MFRYHGNEVQVLKNKPLFIEEILSDQYFQKIRSHKDKSNDLKFRELYDLVETEYLKIDQFRT